ncbi:MAG: glycosyltransferase family 4 protein [Magnetococcales bacterium]|nr:glycosyltransferase family 4 protein [Magnetococcales bacterium]
MALKVLYIDDIPTPYRLAIHQHFNVTGDEHYRVLFCAKEEPGRRWSIDFGKLDYVVLSGWQLRPPKQISPFSFKFNPQVLKELRKFSPDRVVLSGYAHPTMWLAAWWCRHNSVPYGLSCETSESHGNAIKRTIKQIFIGAVLKGISFGLPVSRKAGQFLRKLSQKPNLPIFLFPNTPDTHHIQMETKRGAAAIANREDLTALGVPKSGKIVLFVGRLIAAKRPLDLLNAYLLLPYKIRQNSHLVFVGDGPLAKEVAARCQDGDLLHMLGWISDWAKLTRIMASADVFVLPSSYEPWGTVVNEAMMCGLPVVASDQVGAAREMIEHGKNGFIYPVADIAALELLLEDILQNNHLAKLALAAQTTAKEFNHEFAVKNLRNAIVSKSLK